MCCHQCGPTCPPYLSSSPNAIDKFNWRNKSRWTMEKILQTPMPTLLDWNCTYTKASITPSSKIFATTHMTFRYTTATVIPFNCGDFLPFFCCDFHTRTFTCKGILQGFHSPSQRPAWKYLGENWPSSYFSTLKCHIITGIQYQH